MRSTIRSSSSMVVLMMMLLLHQFAAIISSTPTTYMVGDDDGWDLAIDMQSWTRGKSFHAGDLLVFKYDSDRFDVAVVDKEGHDSCSVNANATVYESGNDKISLNFGPNYFIDTVPEICAAGMKMFINATAPLLPININLR